MASIRQRENSYQITVSKGYDSKGKKLLAQKTVKRPEELTDKQWEKELDRLSHEFENSVQLGTYFESSRFTLSTFIDKWLDEHRKNLEDRTFYRYKDILKGRVNDALGHMKLEQLKPLHLLEFYNNLQEDGIRLDCKEGGLSAQTVKHHHRLLSVMFNDAVRWGLMKENPCLKVQPPKVIRKEMKCLDEEGISLMLECLEKEPIKYQAIITLALVSGCRRGEMTGLQWRYVDFENKVIYIKQAAIYTPATGIKIKIPKTASSIRKISLGNSTMLLLKQYRKWQLEQQLSIGNLWQDDDWVFTSWDGHIISPDSITKIFKKFILRHNIPDIRLHDLRHTSCTMLIQAGLNVRAVASRMGHSDPSVTLATYSHALQSTDREAANILENLVIKKYRQV